MSCSIEKFFYQDLAGIQGPAFHATRYMSPGFRRVCIRPHVLGDLESASTSIKTVRGMVSSSWKRSSNSISLEATIPVNSQARISVPTLGLRNVAVEEGGHVVWQNGSCLAGIGGITGGAESTESVTFDVGSGHYAFKLSGSGKPARTPDR